jgi:hypothetical protein
MHFDSRLFRPLAIAAAILLLYGSRLQKGSARETSAGLSFPVKPLFAWSRAIALPAYILFFIYITATQNQSVSWGMGILFFAAVSLGLMQMPGTILLTPTSIKQRFWLQPSKSMEYQDVVAIQGMQAGRMTRVLGNNGMKITHTSNHCAALEFQTEIERRTGRRMIV